MVDAAPTSSKKSLPIVGVAGLGTMGIGIVELLLLSGYWVIATDAYAPVLTIAPMRISQALDKRIEAGKLTSDARNTALRHLRLVNTPAEMGKAKLVIEAVAEKLDIKRDLFAALERVLGADAVLATNTSSLSVADIAKGLTKPSRVVGLHFFNPAPKMQLVELVGHAGTSDTALALARQVAQDAGKTVVLAPDRPGFIVNRCARPFYGEALALLEEGRTASDIDAAMLAAGYRIGPFALIDLIGADVHLAATEGLFSAMDRHPRYQVFDALRTQIASGRLGRKSGQGFVFPQATGAAPADSAEIVLRIEAALVNEAGHLLTEGTATAAAIDTAMKLGMNFPRGPFEMLKTHGAGRIAGELARLEARAPAHLAGRYTASPALKVPA